MPRFQKPGSCLQPCLEIAVVANGNNGTSKVLKEVFQNCQGSDIQVIGRLIEEKHIGFFNQEF